MQGSERFLAACRRQPVDRTPVWFMRQAGRYQAAYRAIRAKHTLLEIIASAELSAQVTMIPIDHMPVDAAIIFADILPPLVPMGMDLEFVRGEGPVLHNPLSSAPDINALKAFDPSTELAPTMQALTSVREQLGDRAALIGFAGGPFTLASYMIEGGPSRNYAKTKQLIYEQPDAWDVLMTKLGAMTADYLLAQIQAGAQCVQIFDSWAGSLGPRDYREYVLPTTRTVIERIHEETEVPVILFGVTTSGMLDLIAEAGSDVVGVDWRIALDRAWDHIGPDRAIQGNLDPIRLFDSGDSLEAAVKAVLDEAGGRPGHIFNLGHGIIPDTPEETVKQVAELVHSLSAREAKQVSANGRTRVGVMIMAYGGPNSLEDVPAFLDDIRRGRPTPQELVDEITERYEKIGGRSPILELTTAQAKSIERELNARDDGHEYRCYVGMRHWHPFIEEVVPEMLEDSVDLIAGAVMAPHFSRMSVGAYMGKLEKALKENGADVPIVQVRSWKDEPDFIDSVSNKIQEAMAKHYPGTPLDDVMVLFTAHSLPARVVESGDPYREEILTSVELVAKQLGLKQYQFAFQSQGATADPWLGPSVEETLEEFSEKGIDNLLFVPIGFVCDHVEVLFDVDIEHREQAEELGIRLERTEMLNDDPGLAKAVASAVQSAVGERG